MANGDRERSVSLDVGYGMHTECPVVFNVFLPPINTIIDAL